MATTVFPDRLRFWPARTHSGTDDEDEEVEVVEEDVNESDDDEVDAEGAGRFLVLLATGAGFGNLLLGSGAGFRVCHLGFSPLERDDDAKIDAMATVLCVVFSFPPLMRL